MSALAWRGAGLAMVVALIAVWGEIAALKLVSPVFLPTPARVWRSSMAFFTRPSARNSWAR
jgi:sulfonate transport system permease protein